MDISSADRLASRRTGREKLHSHLHDMITRTIPSTGEALPAIGMGTWQTFDVGAERGERDRLKDVLRTFSDAGAKLIDSSPMYGRAEGLVGELLEQTGLQPRAFLATKVWTSGRAEGEAQMRESFRRMRTKRMDLMQVHNLVDVGTHLATLRDWKERGLVRYVGITHYQLRAFGEIERLMRAHPLDFIQIPYSVQVREAEERILPLAQDRGIAVLVMRPFEEGAAFRVTRGRPVPAVAQELGCTSWPQLFLKFILAHPAVTCPIPATSNPAHAADLVRAGEGPLPDAAQRRAIIDAVER